MYDRDTLLAKVATMHYENGYTQTQIAKELNISRPTISSFLKEALDKEIVQIIITHPHKDIFSLEKQLQNIFPDTNILIAAPSNDNKKETVGLDAAQLLEVLLKEVGTVGIGWGTTVAEVIKASDFNNFDHIKILPLIGGMVTTDIKYHSNYLVSEFAQKINAEAEFLYAPAIADSLESKKAFKNNDSINKVLDAARNVDLAIIGIGNPLKNSNYQQHGYLSSEEIKVLNKEEAVGDILTSFFNKNGEIVNTDFSKRMIGLNIDDLKEIKQVLAVATGNEKTVSARIILEHKLVSHLVLDQELAYSILETLEEESKDEDKD